MNVENYKHKFNLGLLNSGAPGRDGKACFRQFATLRLSDDVHKI